MQHDNHVRTYWLYRGMLRLLHMSIKPCYWRNAFLGNWEYYPEKEP